MQAFLETVIRGMVQHPDAVRIVPSERRGETLYEVHVHPVDMGRLVGRRGNTINAIRTLLTAGAAAGVAKILFFVGLALVALFLVLGVVAGRKVV